MATNKARDGGPDGQTRKQTFAGEDDSVEGHQTNKARDGGPEGQTRKQTFAGDDDSVEGHKK